MSEAVTTRFDTFISTKEHRRFIEFANAVRVHRYIGLCFGPAGVGKTLSAWRYADCHRVAELSHPWKRVKAGDAKIFAALGKSRTLFYTPTIGLSAIALRGRLKRALDDAGDRLNMNRRGRVIIDIELIIVDEIERLSASALEALRDLFDRGEVGLILVGMPGMEKRMARYPQLYSRVGFAHHYRPLQGDELSFVLARHWRKLGLSLDAVDFSDTQAVASIARITGGNFRLLHRLFVQIERILKINGLTFITDEVVNAARSTLVIGTA
jgi:DNA transposition AAA+ family ATPase